MRKRSILIVIFITFTMTVSIIITSLISGMSLFTFVYNFVIQPNQLMGNAMVPTYPSGAFIMTQKYAYKSEVPKRGDIILHKGIIDGKAIEFVHRVVGVPGDTIGIHDSKLYLNKQLADEYYIQTEQNTEGGSYLMDGEEILIPTGYYFVLGDNRSESLDSRSKGLVPIDSIIGRVAFCYAHCSK